MDSPSRGKRSSVDVAATDAMPRGPLAAPPTLPFSYFKLAIERLKAAGGPPHRIDRSAWSSRQFRASGALIVPAFRFLQLTDDDGRPREALFAMLAAFGTERWREQLGDVLRTSFDDVLATGIDKATPKDILHLFKRHYRLDAASARMAAAFFVHATREARIDIGPFISASPRAPRSAPRSARAEFRATMLAKLPPFDHAWSDEVKLAWFTAFNEVAAKRE